MATKLDPCIFGQNKGVTLEGFNLGNLTKAIAYSLEEFGVKGVDSIPVKGDAATRLITYEKKARRMEEPYVQAGVVKKDLVLIIRDKKNDRLEAMEVVVKNYKDIRDSLAKSSARVVNLDKGDATIDKAAEAQADRLGTTVEDEDSADFGDITGNIVLCAHGTPKVLPGRVIGTQLGGKSADEIVKLLTRNKDKAKRIGKDYSGTVTLSGCWTGAGGPGGEDAQDDAFAMKVLEQLRSKGYRKLNVVGMPGPSWTAADDSLKDDTFGKTVERGEKGVWPGMSETIRGVEAKRLKIDKLTEALLAAAKKSGDPKGYLKSPLGKQALEKIVAIEKEMQELETRLGGERVGKDIKRFKGRFGLRQIHAELMGGE
jgi:hypothetical protein